jgi:hypothetical protein
MEQNPYESDSHIAGQEIPCEISSSHGSEYEDDNYLGCSTM